MSLQSQLEALQKLANSKQQDQKEAVTTFKKFQLNLIRNGHRLNSEQDLKTAMNGLEIGAQIAINIADLNMFDRVICQLKQYYLVKNIAKLSKKRQHLMGLYLMYLLTENRLGDFHVEIELLSFDDLENKFIKYPINIEQFMMEGSYEKIKKLKNELPDKTYLALTNKLEETVRNEIGASLQAVHNKINLGDALKMLSINDKNTLSQYIKTQKLEWRIDGDILHFSSQKQKQQTIDAVTTIQDMLQFTSNIETIV